MITRERIVRFFLWWAVLGFSIWVGGTLFKMLVIVPLWSASPPESVHAFFKGSYRKLLFLKRALKRSFRLTQPQK